MFVIKKIPAVLKWIFLVLLTFLLLMTVLRFLFFFYYRPLGQSFSIKTHLLGLRYDLRIVGVIGVVMLLLSAISGLNPFKFPAAKRFWNLLLPFFLITLVFFYAVDFFHYDYLHQRLNASVLNYLSDASISWNMMWQTYPVIKILLLLILLVFISRWYFRWLLSKHITIRAAIPVKRKVIGFILSFLLLGVFVFGKIGQFPLRWSDAFSLNDDFKANVALNPFQSFFSTLSFRNSTFDIRDVRSGYSLMAKYLDVEKPDSINLNYERNYIAKDSSANKPNVVLVICESFSAYKSSMYGNPLNTTPYFNEMSKNGLFFDRCFTPAYGTARGIWATITGIPDVENPRTASRNPNAVNQHTIINDFKGYSNFYFIGGSATWANIRGVLTNNIRQLKLFEQEDYTSPKIDVWGISDKNLFLESNKILATQKDPFFAIIQTADNHRPYTIPKEDEVEFKKITVPADSLKRYGFESNDEMNAFRYTDYCYQKFMEAAKQESYFENTIFVFVGDHGIRGNSGDMFPKSWTEQGLTCEHVPLLFYAPKLIAPKRIHQACSQVDILPTVAALANTSYRNTTFGRNLLDTLAPHEDKMAFIIDHDVKTIGLLNNTFYYLKNIKTGKEQLVPMDDNLPLPTGLAYDSLKNYLGNLTGAYYQTAQYLLLNNKKKN